MSEKIYLSDCDLPKDENGREHGLCIWRDIHKKVFCVNNYDHGLRNGLCKWYNQKYSWYSDPDNHEYDGGGFNTYYIYGIPEGERIEYDY